MNREPLGGGGAEELGDRERTRFTPLERSERKGSVLRRQVLERLQREKGGAGSDNGVGGVPADGGEQGVPSGTPTSAWGEESEKPAAGKQQKRWWWRRRSSPKPAVEKTKATADGDKEVLGSPPVASKTISDMYEGIGLNAEEGTAAGLTAPAPAARENKGAKSNSDDDTSIRLRAGVARDRRRSRRRTSLVGVNMIPVEGTNSAVRANIDTGQKNETALERRMSHRKKSSIGSTMIPTEGSNGNGKVEDVRQRVAAARGRRMSRHRKSSTGVNELERSKVKKIGDTFRKLYVPPLGPTDDPPGVIYLDGKLTEKTVDVRVLESVGEGVQEARKELFDMTARRRSLVEEIRAQNRRVSRGFPRNFAVEDMLKKKVEEEDARREEAEGKLKRVLDHRRRLFDVLKASQAEDDKSVLSASNIARSELPPTETGTNVEGGVEGNDTRTRPRRSSLDDLKGLARELMGSEPAITAREVATANCSRRPSVTSIEANDHKKISRKKLKRQLDQGWRDLMEAIFSEERERCSKVVCFREQVGENDRESKEADIRGFLEATTPKEHVEFLITAMDPARADDLPAVIKCVLLHYTGPAADELDILLGGRLGEMGVQGLLEMSLHALDEVHAEHVPSILMLQWLLGRAPYLRSLLLKGGVIGRAFRRLERVEAKGFGSGERAMQYAALFVTMGLLFE